MNKIYTYLDIFPSQFLPPLIKYNNSFVYVDSIKECDYVLLPYWEVIYEYNASRFIDYNVDPKLKTSIQKSARDLISHAESGNKPIIIFYLSDSDKDISIANSIVLRTSLYKSTQKPNVFAYPSWNGDFQKDYMNGLPNLKAKKEEPHVGFRGSAVPFNFSLENLIRSKMNVFNTVMDKLELSYHLPYAWNKGQLLRRSALNKLKGNTNIKTDFTILTRGYISQKSAKIKEDNRRLFVQNVVDNDYILCVRGAGNYSYRLYETLSAGRIPIIINTDCVLPYDFIIDWKKYCVWVEEEDINWIDEILLEFHSKLSKTDFLELQISIRQLWNEWISPPGFFKNFDMHFDQAKKE